MKIDSNKNQALKRRVVITGLGTVNPIGNNVSETWAAAIEGKSGIGRISHFDISGKDLFLQSADGIKGAEPTPEKLAPFQCPVTIAGEVKQFDPTVKLPPIDPFCVGTPITQAMNIKDARKMGRFSQLSMIASYEAYVHSRIDSYRGNFSATRVGVNIGVGMGGLPEIEDTYLTLTSRGYRRVTPFFVPMTITNLAAGNVGILLNAKGPNLCAVSACASSAHAIGESFRAIQRGDADVFIAGGAEATISPLGIAGFASARALSSRNDAPEKASRPYDADRDGFVMGEGAATLILEEYEFAKKRGAKILAEIVGYGATSDAYHITLPAPEGEGGARAMQLALDEAEIAPNQIDYINSHGTSTPAGDAEEARAIRGLFKNETPNNLHVSSTKSMTGHLLGAAGAIESLFCTLAIQTHVIPPTINLDSPDPKVTELGLNLTPHKAVKKNVNIAMSNSFGFGGTNVSLVLRKVE